MLCERTQPSALTRVSSRETEESFGSFGFGKSVYIPAEGRKEKRVLLDISPQLHEYQQHSKHFRSLLTLGALGICTVLIVRLMA